MVSDGCSLLWPLTGPTVICPGNRWQVEQAVIRAAADDAPVHIGTTGLLAGGGLSASGVLMPLQAHLPGRPVTRNAVAGVAAQGGGGDGVSWAGHRGEPVGSGQGWPVRALMAD